MHAHIHIRTQANVLYLNRKLLLANQNRRSSAVDTNTTPRASGAGSTLDSNHTPSLADELLLVASSSSSTSQPLHNHAHSNGHATKLFEETIGAHASTGGSSGDAHASDVTQHMDLIEDLKRSVLDVSTSGTIPQSVGVASGVATGSRPGTPSIAAAAAAPTVTLTRSATLSPSPSGTAPAHEFQNIREYFFLVFYPFT